MAWPGFVVSVGEGDRELAEQLDREIYEFYARAIGVDDGRPLSIRERRRR